MPTEVHTSLKSKITPVEGQRQSNLLKNKDEEDEGPSTSRRASRHGRIAERQ
jgi:hypothetical protein